MEFHEAGDPDSSIAMISSQFQYYFQWIDHYGACFNTGIATGAGIDLFFGNIVLNSDFPSFKPLPSFCQTGADFLHPVSRIHHYFSRGKFFTGDVSWTF